MAQNPIISFPTPAYQNVPINVEFYQPSQFFITAITLGITTTVTTSVTHNYVVGQLVRLLIPFGWGSTQLNEKTGYVISIPTTSSVEIDINSVGVDPFRIVNLTTKPQIVAVGDGNSGAINATGRVNQGLFIPGSFINISP